MSDVEDMVESERLQEIYSMKQQVYETKDEVERAVASGRINRGVALGLYQRKVRDYVMAVETLLDPHDGEPSDYWGERRVGDFVLPDGRHVNVDGLGDFLELPVTYDVEVEQQQQKSYRHKAEKVTKKTAARPPQQLIERAFRMTNKALDAAGFDIDEPTERDRSKFKNADDVEKGAIVLDYLRSLDTPDLREAKNEIDRIITEQRAQSNGHHE
jgi:hypothetical protein